MSVKAGALKELIDLLYRVRGILRNLFGVVLGIGVIAAHQEFLEGYEFHAFLIIAAGVAEFTIVIVGKFAGSV